MKTNPSRFQPTFDKVILLADVTHWEFGHAVTDLAVEFAESYLGKGEQFEKAREVLYATPEFWVWFKRLIANASLKWIDVAESSTPLRITDDLWEYWQKLMRIYMNLYTPTDYVVEAYCRQLETA